MFLTFEFAPIFILLVSFMTFLALRYNDPINLNDYKTQMGVNPVICCFGVLLPVVVLILYGIAMKLGPQPSKVGIKV